MSQVIDVPEMGLVSFPDGMSDADIVSAIKRSSAPPRQAPSYGALIPNAGNKAIAGTADMLLNAPANVWNLVKAGAGTLATAAGRPDLAPDLTPTPDFARRGMSALGFIRPDAEPVGPTQRIVDAATQGGVGMAMNPASSGRQLASLMATGGLSGAASQGTKEATGSDTAAQLVGLASPVAAGMAANSARSRAQELAAEQSRNAPRDQALAAALQEGYKVPPGQASPGKYSILESVAGKQAIQQATSTANQEVTDALMRRSIGLPENAPLTPQATQQVRRGAYQAGYAPLANAGPISTGRLYRNELDGIAAKYVGAAQDFPAAVRDDVQNMVDGLKVRTFDAGNGVKMAQILRDDAGKAFTSGDSALGQAKISAANAIENQIERGIQPTTPNAQKLMSDFREARQLMAKAHTVEDAINVGTGNVDARKVAAALQNGAPLTGEQKIVAEFANNFKKATQPPSMVGSPGVSKLGAFAAALLGGGGAGIGGHSGGASGAALGATLGTAASVLAPRVAQSYLLSKRVQNGLMPDYGGQALDRLLFAPLPELSSGGAMAPALLAEQLRRGN